MPLFELAVIFICLACGGILKGATGAGAPILAIPALAAFYDVRFAIVILTVPNIVTNFTQLWRNRQFTLPRYFLIPFVGAAAIGVLAGSWVLLLMDTRTLSVIVALAVVLYLLVRSLNSRFVLSLALASKLALPTGFLSGLLQGAAGMSAPISISFLNAMKLDRQVFMCTVSLLFVTFGSLQLMTLSLIGIITPELFMLSCIAVFPMLMGMPIGSAISRKISRRCFDRLIMLLLAGLAMRMLWEAIALAS
ncbi:sulfite exporter TauE/SafE family protein [Devosia sp. WQ 349]|uniref:sulfite exporter TauE/SafE family protein n=1 Tax=Devosia sp. WQ 349K1 TaxID=2800329 RepID=UPI001908E175|nr:sulfite exporter TauE/SafE family protein [Devosia sp. WQ 349K1]MBK1795503.1 sulfite exporter TauE/SafE family protein [Devosia sp. WQ 349K1]